ncbi:MAG: DNA gyrase subunit B [Armatimonadetes bacterium]|nr:DNA gyrase subunit B [Armatimonadota bacterium]
MAKASRSKNSPKPTDGQEQRDIGHASSDYTAADIQVLKGLEAVRQRPAMFIGDTSVRGLHHLFNEVLDNSIDEALAGHCDRIVCTVHTDNSLSVADNGRGIPVGIHEEYKISALEIVMCTLHAGAKFGGGGYRITGGLHGVGVSCVNALSEWCEVTVQRDGKKHEQRYERGVPVADVKLLGNTTERGTTTRWMADPEVFEEVKYDSNILKTRIRELAYLNSNITIEFVNEQQPDQNELFQFKDGIVALVEHINETHVSLHKPIYFKRSRDETEIEVALQYHDGYKETLITYANNINTIEGGTHATGAKTALTRVINQYARKMHFIKEKDVNLLGEDVRGGLTLVVAVKLLHPQFEGQTKTKLGNSEIEGLVTSVFHECLTEFLDENPDVARRIVEKSLTEQRAREAARKVAEAVRRSGAVESYGLAAKLADCSEKDPAKTELFIVEGDSAGGSAKGARDRRYQAVLPIKGKILNVERARVDKALDNEEIKALISTLGTGIDVSIWREHDEDEEPSSNGFDISRLRYGKVIILTDADVDGEHIRTLLLTFFYRYMKPLLVNGHIYFAQPPLFTIKVGKNERYFAQSEEERDEILKTIKRKKDVQITRFKGLGEMNAEQLEETTMNPKERVLFRIKYDPLDQIERDHTEDVFSRLMGERVDLRREFIESHAKEATDLDWHY